ncbi:MAG: ABC transporter ATP-binding protein [Bacteroidales bacterium]|jgi:lipoprotein-releasing system ATP-binding protein|nr:lipoprotein-releasing system ATP-binding protein LolD [Lentimicrobiaceae bacterium]MDG1135738.1 ABC transporter ATP-binding protein [Bacteroidales bacterium]MDG1901583.1 ABC transporter ATP-binding protein [Bacteroidales bacterium]MDG2081632.1 ABC transporter ATP-binding protein [Bacteroidales bacterium]
MVTAKDIVKSYGDVDVLMGVNLNISKGEIVSIVGKSGSGKSTLLQILGTIENPDAGKVVIDNTDILSLSRKELASFRNKNIGFVFQFHHLLPEFTALENICIPALISGDNKSTAESKAKELLGYLELSHRSNHKPDAMSGGEQQRVAIARSLINRPSIILADEPSGNLDSSASSELHKLILNLRKQLNQTFIIVTHNKDLADMADRKLEIADGLI